MSRLGTPEILILAFLVIIFFGSKRLPEFIKSVGHAVREFKKSLSE